jgi:two-component system, NarL family, nitrate/nitrite response regulator NarL
MAFRPLLVAWQSDGVTMTDTHADPTSIAMASDPANAFLIVDEHALVRHGFALSLGEIMPGVSVIETGSLDEALAVTMRTPDLRLVLCDQPLALADSGEGLKRLVEALMGGPVLIVAGSEDPAAIVESVRLGARGYILKSSSPAVLEHAISLALTRETYLPLPRAVLAGGVKGGEGDQRTETVLNRLTDRQRDVFQLLLAGRSNKEIARTLGVLEGTVKVHVRAIMQKLGVRNRTQVAVLAARSGCHSETDPEGCATAEEPR